MGEAESAPTEGRRGGRRSRRAERLSAPLVMLPTLVRDIPVYEVVNAEGLERIHEASMRILEEVGIEFRDEESLGYWRAAGAEIAGQRVRIARELLLELVDKAPESFTLHARNPDLNTTIGGRHTVFAPSYGSPFFLDFNGERRYSTLADYHTLLKLSHQQPALQVSGGVLCEPMDVAVPKRHLRMVEACITHSDKPFMGSVTAGERAEDSVTMAKIVFGEDFVDNHAVMVSVCNCNSPLVWDQTMLDAVKVYARHHQPVILAPFVMAGASTSASSVGAIAQLNAEALAGVAFAQTVRPGVPMIYGHYLATVSMRSGAPMAGTPEISLMNLVTGQLARRYRVPLRSSGMITGSKLVDAQAGYESMATMWAVLLSGANFVLHAAGWLESALTASPAKFVLDAEQIEMLYRLAAGLSFDDLEEALGAVREVGPGGHFLGTKHTREHFQSAFYMPELMNFDSYEQWQAEGAKDANQRALEKARALIDRYPEVAPVLDPAVAEELTAFVARREAELPDSVS